jgi:23S rRNA (cytosine1962-C5)-methyltransferase
MVQTQDPLMLIENAIRQRNNLLETTNAYRLFNGFYEGMPGIVLDRYDQTLVIFDHRERSEPQTIIQEIGSWAIKHLDWVASVILKQRNHPDQRAKNGLLISGENITSSIHEFDVQYALDLQMNQDAGFYLDTRNLRRWLLNHMFALRVLNTFAYTGSLGVAAGAGGAALVIQTDLNRQFMDISQRSWLLNGMDKGKHELLTGDFFKVTGRFRHQDKLFDCVIIDPPYFSQTSAGRIDLQNETTRLVNKVRPLVAHEGWLVLINNALYLSGSDFMNELNGLCESEYLTFEQIISVPPDITGYPNTVVDGPPVDPSPFNHPTKIAILNVTRKDQRRV